MLYYYAWVWELKFVWDWSILQYSITWWTFRSINFYIIERNKTIEWKWILSLFGFSKNNEYFYMCWVMWMSWSGEFKVYDTKNWDIIKDFTKDYNSWIYCKIYDEINNILEFTLPLNDEIKYLYNFDTKNTIEK